ncbi:hypothetical protein HJC23_006538 [Cyclotella cryptica]|uniref:HSF-type DNA-binding domain-containing protein n=1 Tax=Cyclotella cryptica TaxID=29204 RepID=A0ABD3PJU1_9STRA|eukprot:CCRYP_013619-RA/>CCRYP_013619-RA protein AED:0.02 eAED:0.02 QI:277/1/1/1/1/1/2/163/593
MTKLVKALTSTIHLISRHQTSRHLPTVYCYRIRKLRKRREEIQALKGINQVVMSSDGTPHHEENEKVASFVDSMSSATAATAAFSPNKRINDDDHDGRQEAGRHDQATPKPKKRRKSPQVQDVSELTPAPYPFFCYSDHSRDTDMDRLALLEEADHVPSFPVKMHAILSDPELKSIISWDTHGRSFKILRPRDFESKVLPRFFEHASMASFQRQVNGWGFRRLTEGDNRNSYYEEHFLRSLPWLCKKMRRPKVGEKKKSPVQYEPDLVAISKIFPLPTTSTTREIQIVLEVIKKGPKAKIPANWLSDELYDPEQAQKGSDLAATDEDTKPAAAQNHPLSAPDILAPYPLATISAPPPLPVSNPQALLSLLQQNEYSNSRQHALHQTSLAGSLYPIVGRARSHENQLITGMSAAARSQNDRNRDTLFNSLVSDCTATPLSGNSLLASLVAFQTQHHALTATQGHRDISRLVNGNPAMPTTENALALALCAASQNLAISNIAAAPQVFPNQLTISLRLQEMINQVNLGGAGRGMGNNATQSIVFPNSSNIGQIQEGIRGNFADDISNSTNSSTLDLNDLDPDRIEALNRLFRRQY